MGSREQMGFVVMNQQLCSAALPLARPAAFNLSVMFSRHVSPLGNS